MPAKPAAEVELFAMLTGEVGRWWMPGQHAAGGEQPNWNHTPHRCHHPLRCQDRLYVSYWHSGFVILDISDMGQPKKVSGLDWSLPFHWPTHTCLPIPFPGGRRIMLVADEDVSRIGAETPSFLWVVDINDKKHPIPFSSFQVEGENGEERPRFTGCHQPCEIVTGTEIPVAWFAHGLRIADFSKPHALREVAHYVSGVSGFDNVQATKSVRHASIPQSIRPGVASSRIYHHDRRLFPPHRTEKPNRRLVAEGLAEGEEL